MKERWQDVPGTDGAYQVSTKGNVRRYWRVSKKHTPVKPFVKTNCRKGSNRKTIRIRMTMPDGRRVEKTILTLVAEVFVGIPDGMVAVHRNGIHSDNTLQNIIFMPPRCLGILYGARSARRPVVMIDRDGRVMEAYSSAREAAKHNHMSYQTVMDRCNGKRKREYALTGFTFRWDDRKDDKRY